MSDSDVIARRRIPDQALAPLIGSGATVPLRAARQGTVLVLLGVALAERDRAYLRALAEAEPALRGWDGRVLVVVAAGNASAVASELAALELPFPVLADPTAVVAAAAGVEPPALVVSDQWGEVHASVRAADPTGWLPPTEVEQWLRFIAVRCGG